MLYALLCYGSEDAVAASSSHRDGAVARRCEAAVARMRDFGAPGPAFSLMPTTTAITLRPGARPLILDGPFEETREQLLAIWLHECANLEEAVAAAQLLAGARGLDEGALEIRPVSVFDAVAPTISNVDVNVSIR